MNSKLFKSLLELVVVGSIIAILLSGCASSRSSSQAEESSLITTNSTEITETAAVINQAANTVNSENTSAPSNTTTKVTVGILPSSNSESSANATSKATAPSSTQTSPTAKVTTQPPPSSTTPTIGTTTASTTTAGTTVSAPTTTQLTHNIANIQSSIISGLKSAGKYDATRTDIGGTGYADFDYSWTDYEIISSTVDSLSDSPVPFINISVEDTGSGIRVSRTNANTA